MIMSPAYIISYLIWKYLSIQKFNNWQIIVYDWKEQVTWIIIDVQNLEVDVHRSLISTMRYIDVGGIGFF